MRAQTFKINNPKINLPYIIINKMLVSSTILKTNKLHLNLSKNNKIYEKALIKVIEYCKNFVSFLDPPNVFFHRY
jgi:hypothetical protein